LTAAPLLRQSGTVLTICAGVLAGVLAIGGAEVSLLVPVGAIIVMAVATLALWRPMLAVYLAVLLIPLESFTAIGGSTAPTGVRGGITAAELVALAAAGGFLVRLVADWERPLDSPLLAPLLLLVVALVPGLFLAKDPYSVLKQLGMWSAFFVIFVGVFGIRERRTTEYLSLSIAVAGGIVAAIAVVHSGGTDQAATDAGGFVSNRATGPFGGPVLLSAFLAMVLPVQVAFMLRGRATWERVGGGIAAGLSLIALALALTRSAFLAVAVVVIWFFVAWRPFRRLVLVLLVLLGISLVTGANPASNVVNVDVVSKRIESTASTDTETGKYRFELWTDSLHMTADNLPFGVGAKNFVEKAPIYGAFDPQGFPYEHAHNLPLTIAAELGVLGLLAVGWFAFALTPVLSRALRITTDPEHALAIALTAAFLAIATDGIFDYAFDDNVFTLTVFLLAAVAARLEGAARHREVEATREVAELAETGPEAEALPTAVPA
jgi:O-antigen ligase